MTTRHVLVLSATLLLAALPGRSRAAEARTAPLPASAKPVWSHGPFEMGDCKICHATDKPTPPAKLNRDAQALCLDCHDQLAEQIAKRKHKHEATETCVACHSPHNARNAKGLHTAMPALCQECHEVDAAKHPKGHTPAKGETCVACHDPHGADKKALAK